MRKKQMKVETAVAAGPAEIAEEKALRNRGGRWVGMATALISTPLRQAPLKRIGREGKSGPIQRMGRPGRDRVIGNAETSLYAIRKMRNCSVPSELLNQQQRTMFIKFLVCWILLLLMYADRAWSFEVTGELEYRQATFKRGVYQDVRRLFYQFQAVAEGGKWRIRTTPSENPAATYDYAEAGFDGQTLYYVRSMASWVEDQVRSGKQVGSNTASGIILNRPVPQFGMNHELGPIWLAYASGDYFSSLKDEWAFSPLSRGVGPKGSIATRNAYKQAVRVSGSESSLAIPSKVFFLETNIAGVSGIALTNATFEVLTYTNLGQLRVPLKSLVKTFRFYSEPGTETTAMIVTDEYELTTQSVKSTPARPSFVPSIDEVTYISDLRFENAEKAPPVFHYYRQGSWLSESAARKLSEYKEALRQEDGVTVASSAAATVRGLLIILVLVSLPIFAVLWKRRKAAAQI
jgi:hypothetical protein